MGFDEDEFGEGFDLGEDEGEDLLKCPSCGQMVFDDTEKCPHCGDWIMPLAEHARTPVWLRIAGGIVAGVFLLGILAGVIRMLWR